MKQICIGILAHVDAGKTTLSEALLYRAGAIRRLGAGGHQDAFLDPDTMERQRGHHHFLQAGGAGTGRYPGDAAGTPPAM